MKRGLPFVGQKNYNRIRLPKPKPNRQDFWTAAIVAAIFCMLAAVIVDSASSQPTKGATEICRNMYGHKVECDDR